ncbi:hypothetical protein Efla_001217 [Eimeria flavescens]
MCFNSASDGASADSVGQVGPPPDAPVAAEASRLGSSLVSGSPSVRTPRCGSQASVENASSRCCPPFEEADQGLPRRSEAESAGDKPSKRNPVAIPGVLGEGAGYRFALGGILVYFEGCGAERASVRSSGRSSSSSSSSSSSPAISSSSSDTSSSSTNGSKISNARLDDGLLDASCSSEGAKKKGCCCCRGCLTWGSAAEPAEKGKQQQQQQQQEERETGEGWSSAEDVGRRRETGGAAEEAGCAQENTLCLCCSAQPEIAARRQASRCCCCCPFNDCRAPLAEALARALAQGACPTDASMLQQTLQQQHGQRQQQHQEQQPKQQHLLNTDALREAEPGGGGEPGAVSVSSSTKRETEDAGASSRKEGRVAAAAEEACESSHNNTPFGAEAEETAPDNAVPQGGGRHQAEKQQQAFPSLLQSITGGSSSVLASLVKLPLPAPPSAAQMLQTAWRVADTKLVVPKDSLLFDSRFESGNLLAAVKGIYEPNVYLLVLRPDAKRNNKTCWFFFCVQTPQRAGGSQRDPPLTVTFKVLNLVKSNNFYSRGLGAPFVFSSEAFRERGEGWRRSEGPVRFFRNSAAAAVNYILEGCSSAHSAAAGPGGGGLPPPEISPPPSPAAAAAAAAAAGGGGGGIQHWTYDAESPATDLRASYFSLEFDFTFSSRDGDRVFFASCLPYTYSDLLDLTAAMRIDPRARQRCSVQTLCLTPGGLPCPVFFARSLPRAASGAAAAACRHANSTEQQLSAEGSPASLSEGSPAGASSPTARGGGPPLPSGGPPSQSSSPPRDPLPSSSTLLKALEGRCPWFDMNACVCKIQRCKEGTGRVVALRELGVVCSYTLEASVFCHGAADSQRWREALRLAEEREAGAAASRDAACNNTGGSSTTHALGPSEPPGGPSPPTSRWVGPFTPRVPFSGSSKALLQCPGSSKDPFAGAPDGGAPLTGSPPSEGFGNTPLSGSPPVRGPGGPPSLLHFDAGSLLLTGVSVGLAVYDWALHIVRGAPGLLQPGGPPAAANSEKPVVGPHHACTRCLLLGKAAGSPHPPMSTLCHRKPYGGPSLRRRGTPHRRQESAGQCSYETWGLPLRVGGPLRGPREGNSRGASAPPPQAEDMADGPLFLPPTVQGPDAATASEGPSSEEGAPLPTAESAARVAASAVRRSLRYFAARASAAGLEFEGPPQGPPPPPATSPLRVRESVLLVDPPGLLRAPEARPLFRGPSRGGAPVTGRLSRASQRPLKAAAAAAAAAGGNSLRLHRAADGPGSPLSLGVPQGPYGPPGRIASRDFKGDSKTAAPRLCLRMQASGRGSLTSAVLCSSSGQTACCGGPRRFCEEETAADPQLVVAIPMQGPPSARAPEHSLWGPPQEAAHGGPIEPGSPYKGPWGPRPDTRGSGAPCRGCLQGGSQCPTAAAAVLRQQQQQEQQRISWARRGGPHLRWALSRVTAVGKQLLYPKDSTAAERAPLPATARQRPREGPNALQQAGRGQQQRVSARSPPHPSLAEKGGSLCCCQPSDGGPLLDLKQAEGPSPSWRGPSASNSPLVFPKHAREPPEEPSSLGEAHGPPQGRGPRSSWLQAVPPSAVSPLGRGVPLAAAAAGSIFAARGWPGGRQLWGGPLSELESLTVTRVTPTAKPSGRPRRHARGGPLKGALLASKGPLHM